MRKFAAYVAVTIALFVAMASGSDATTWREPQSENTAMFLVYASQPRMAGPEFRLDLLRRTIVLNDDGSLSCVKNEGHQMPDMQLVLEYEMIGGEAAEDGSCGPISTVGQ